MYYESTIIFDLSGMELADILDKGVRTYDPQSGKYNPQDGKVPEVLNKTV